MADSELQSVWECFGVLSLVSQLENSVSTYKQKVLSLVTTHISKTHMFAWFLVCEAKLANTVPRCSTKLVGGLGPLTTLVIIESSVFVQKKQVQGSMQADFA